MKLAPTQLSLVTQNINTLVGGHMKKHKSAQPRKYSKKASSKVERSMHEMKEGKLKSGRSGKKVKSRKQAIAIGLSEARKAGAKVPSRSKT
jgi:hypothetical protein